jgi:hypothetical protein
MKSDGNQIEGEAVSKLYSELESLNKQKKKIEATYLQLFPKVDSYLIHDVLMRISEDPKKYRDTGPFYTIEVFAKEGTNSDWCKNHILETTGTVPAVYDNGTHYVTHMRVTPNVLKRLNDFDFVEEVVGDYTGSGPSLGPMHDRGEIAIKRKDDRRIKTW